MKTRNFFKRDHAVAGVIEALLLVGLVAVILSIIQLYYIPQIMEQREAEHMDELANQFSFLKSIIDLQSMTKENVPISSPITLGSRELPYFVTARADGKISIIDYDDYEINVDFGAETFPLTSIKYEAFNRYYLDGTPVTYALEGGAVIIKQYDGETIRVEPKITVENQTSDINIYYDIPILVGMVGKKNANGCPPYNCFIRTNYSSSDANWISRSILNNINITTDYPTAWYNYLNNTLEDNVNLEQGSYYVKITEDAKQINLYYKKTYIYAQVSPGWIT